MKINKNYKYISAFFLLTLSLFLVSCEEEINDENYLSSSFVSFAQDQVIDMNLGETVVVEAEVYASEASNSDRVFDIFVDDSSTATATQYSAPSTVTIPAGSMKGVVEVVVTHDGGLGFGGKTIVLGMTPVANVDIPTSFTGSSTDPTVTQNFHIITARTFCPDVGVTMEFTLDSWPEEFYWQILNDAGTSIITSIGTYSLYNNPYANFSGDVTEERCLPSGDYIFQAFDDYSDGGTDITIKSGGSVLFTADGGDYEDFIQAEFSL